MTFAVQEIFTPILHDIATPPELQMLHDTVPSEISRIDDLVTHARKHRKSIDLSTLVHATNTMKYHEEKSYWYFPTLFILCFVGYNFIPHLHFEILLDQTNSDVSPVATLCLQPHRCPTPFKTRRLQAGIRKLQMVLITSVTTFAAYPLRITP
jgi:hypothetical protein